MSLVSSLNIARTGLSASQEALTIISNNISNIDNENYSKLSISLADVGSYSAANPYALAESLSGVKVSSITRNSSDYLTSYYRQEDSKNSYLTKYSQTATSIGNITNELSDSGLSTALSNFYTAVTALNNSPTDTSLRGNYVAAAQNLCSVFNTASTNLTKIQTSLVGDISQPASIDSSEIATDVTSVNDLLDQIASVNNNIQETASSGITSSSLLDERDSLLKSLSELTNVDIDQSKEGTVTVSMGGHTLVSGSTVKSYLGVETGDSTNPAKVTLVDKNNQPVLDNQGNKIVVNDSITSGTIGAVLDATGTNSSDLNVSGVISYLNQLANGVTDIMNTIQIGDPSGDNSSAMALTSDGKKLTQSTNTIFVNSSLPTSTRVSNVAPTVAGDVAGTKVTTSTDASGNVFTNYVTTSINATTGMTSVVTISQAAVTAANISINKAVSSNNKSIATARVTGTAYAAGNYTADTGNNSNVTLITASRTNTYASLGNQTMEGFLSTSTTNTATEIKSISTNTTTQASVLKEVKTQLSSVKGVDMDEELTEMIKYQRAYQASARVFSTCSDLMETLINLGK